MKVFFLHALVFGMALGLVAQERFDVPNTPPLSLFEVLVFDSATAANDTQEI